MLLDPQLRGNLSGIVLYHRLRISGSGRGVGGKRRKWRGLGHLAFLIRPGGCQGRGTTLREGKHRPALTELHRAAPSNPALTQADKTLRSSPLQQELPVETACVEDLVCQAGGERRAFRKKSSPKRSCLPCRQSQGGIREQMVGDTWSPRISSGTPVTCCKFPESVPGWRGHWKAVVMYVSQGNIPGRRTAFMVDGCRGTRVRY